MRADLYNVFLAGQGLKVRGYLRLDSRPIEGELLTLSPGFDGHQEWYVWGAVEADAETRPGVLLGRRPATFEDFWALLDQVTGWERVAVVLELAKMGAFGQALRR